VVTLVLACYLLAAVAVTSRLWADPASRTVAGNPNDADLFAWFMRYVATAVAHGRLPALVTAAMNAPQGISLMWNTSVLLPGLLLTPVTFLAGPQTALTVLMTAGFAGSAASLFLVLRRWNVSTGAAALAGAVYGFSPALLQAGTGHYNLQFAVLPPLIVHMGLRLCIRSGRSSPRTVVRDGLVLGLLVTAQLFTGEELLMLAGITGLLLLVVLAASRPREVSGRCGPAAAGLAVGTVPRPAGPARQRVHSRLLQERSHRVRHAIQLPAVPHCCQRRGGRQVPGRCAGIPRIPGLAADYRVGGGRGRVLAAARHPRRRGHRRSARTAFPRRPSAGQRDGAPGHHAALALAGVPSADRDRAAGPLVRRRRRRPGRPPGVQRRLDPRPPDPG
jgi:hypothetical protein